MMGSPRYMSPEQMISAKDVDVRTDVWALGVILYELVTGEPVWIADTVQGLCALIASSPAPKVRAKAPRAPAALEEIVERCLAKTREARLQSVADLALALAPIAPPGAKTSIDRILRVAGRSPHEEKDRTKRFAAIIGATVAALLAVGVAANVRRGPSVREPGSEPVPVVVSVPVSIPATSPETTPAASPPAPPTPATRTIAAKPPPAPVRSVASAVPPAPAASSSPPPAASTPSRALTDRK
jgi:serine/threonine-protein kinase